MANTKQSETNKTNTEVKELNMDAKVNVVSIAKQETSFGRIQEGTGTVRIMPGGGVRLSRNEIIAQVQNGNPLICGTDGLGSHATLYIDDKPTRIEAGFETASTSQNVLTNKKVKELFNLSQDKFEKALYETVVTRDEKDAVMDLIRELGINDYQKIRLVESYTHHKL